MTCTLRLVTVDGAPADPFLPRDRCSEMGARRHDLARQTDAACDRRPLRRHQPASSSSTTCPFDRLAHLVWPATALRQMDAR